jgi:hypothetical protein
MPTLRAQVEGIIRNELEKARVEVDWNMNEVHVLPGSNIVIEWTSSSGSLSHGLIEHFFPAEQAGIEVAHFTTLAKFKGIMESGELRLRPLLNRIDEEEFVHFVNHFGLLGYLNSEDGDPYYKTLMRDLFYASFTDPKQDNEDYMWKAFGDQGNGVKIIFRISPIDNRAEVRRVQYKTEKDAFNSLIAAIMRRIHDECGRHFVMRGISRIGAFYLPLGYYLELETEIRLLVKSWGNGPAHELIASDAFGSYMGLCLRENTFCSLDVVKVECRNYDSLTEIQSAIMESSFPEADCVLVNRSGAADA